MEGKCSFCHGVGRMLERGEEIQCPVCKGVGELRFRKQSGIETHPCPKCGGNLVEKEVDVNFTFPVKKEIVAINGEWKEVLLAGNYDCPQCHDILVVVPLPYSNMVYRNQPSCLGFCHSCQKVYGLFEKEKEVRA